MKTLYLECAMGAAGDMLTAALLELTENRKAFVDRINALGLPGVSVAAEEMVKCGITGTHMKVTVNGCEEESADAADHELGDRVIRKLARLRDEHVRAAHDEVRDVHGGEDIRIIERVDALDAALHGVLGKGLRGVVIVEVRLHELQLYHVRY